MIKIYPKLETLKIECNEIKEIDLMKRIEGTKLNKIYLEGNPIIQNDKAYKKTLFNIFPELIVIDKEDRLGEYIYSSNSSLVEQSEMDELKDSSQYEEIDNLAEENEIEKEEDDNENEKIKNTQVFNECNSKNELLQIFNESERISNEQIDINNKKPKFT